jgi:alcohol dehydrogenase (NADP+)
MVVQEHFAILIPQDYPLEYAGPVMCAGVTLYNPLFTHGAKKGSKIGIIGGGGLGSIGIQIATAMECEVTLISRAPSEIDIGDGKQPSPRKKAATALGATSYICSVDKSQMTSNRGKFDLLLNTIPIEHNFSAYNSLLNSNGKHIILGLNSSLIAGIVVGGITGQKSRVLGSAIGSIKCTQSTINLCAQHKIYPTISIINVDEINAAYGKLDSGNDNGCRYVLNIKDSLNESAFELCKDVPPPEIGPNSGISFFNICGSICTILCCCYCC